MAVYIDGVEIGQIMFMRKAPLQKPKQQNRKRRREIAKAQGLLRRTKDQ